ncbi:hypothetical protein [Actinoplanes sp. L3-i22]|uniref:hypothetical protein n=1 Tax=Actinoplanes sp. L3-i22 TaxID=2836373 RepID=UPI001C78C6FA|nr:hypothetical protein [Actinoplanes sp. L3-i22]BCY04993.1 hypothetical protein L3i22_000810 [Actinoplanes sp. L3-i22]
MPHRPDDDGYEPPLKVLRKRFNGVYREDHGLSGPTRRYLMLVAMLVALASVPTLAVITAGTREISGNDRSGALDAPFLPPPMTGPVRPSPPTQNHSAYDHPGRPPSVSVQPSTAPPGVSPPVRTADPVPTVPGLPEVPADEPPVLSAKRRSNPADGGMRRPKPVATFPTIPNLPAVPDDDWQIPVGRRAFPDSSDDGDSGDGDSGSWRDDPSADEDADDSTDPDAADEQPADEQSADEEPADQDQDDEDQADEADEHDHSPHHECEVAFRSTVSDRPRVGPASAGGQHVTERPQNVNAARILDYDYPTGRNVRRSMAQPYSEEGGRNTNRPYRGHHRAEHTLHDENGPARRRSSRVGRHHAGSDAAVPLAADVESAGTDASLAVSEAPDFGGRNARWPRDGR